MILCRIGECVGRGRDDTRLAAENASREVRRMALHNAIAEWLEDQADAFGEGIRSGDLALMGAADQAREQELTAAAVVLLQAHNWMEWGDDTAPTSPESVGAALERAVATLRAAAVDLGWQPEREVITPKLRTLIYRRDGYACVLCGHDDVLRLTIDHRIPVDLGGSNEPVNLRTLCRPCNSRKGARL